MLSFVAVLSSILAVAQALDINGAITANDYLVSPAILSPSTLVTLSSANLGYKTHPSIDGSFTFHNVTAGPSYILEVECISHVFAPFRIDTQNGVEVYQTFLGNEWSHRGAKLQYPIQLEPSSKADYYVVHIPHISNHGAK